MPRRMSVSSKSKIWLSAADWALLGVFLVVAVGVLAYAA